MPTMVPSESESRLRSLFSVRRLRRVDAPSLPFIHFGLAPVAGLIMLLLFAMIPFARGVIEQAAERATQEALSDVGADWATARVSGQWVILQGTPPSRAAGMAAMDAVREQTSPTLFGAVPPVTRVRERYIWDDPAASEAVDAEAPDAVDEDRAPVDLEASLPAASEANVDWRFDLERGVLRLEGQVPDEATRAAILEAARIALDPPRIVSINEDLEVLGETPPEGYTDIALRGVDAIQNCDRGAASFADGAFSVFCQGPSAGIDAVRNIVASPLELGRIGDIELLESEAVEACDQSLSDLLDSSQIRFATSSAVIDAASAAVLDDVAEAAQACPGRLQIEGHTDDSGGASLNLLLSQRRAGAVRTALINRGVASDRLIARGFGPDRPIADNTTEDGRAENRRIEIRVARGSQPPQ